MVASLKAKNVSCSEIGEEGGAHPSIILPSGSEIGLYQPKNELTMEKEL